MIIHRTNVARGHRGLFALLHLLFGDRRATRWLGCTPQRVAWDRFAEKLLFFLFERPSPS